LRSVNMNRLPFLPIRNDSVDRLPVGGLAASGSSYRADGISVLLKSLPLNKGVA
jgi:hypothetical protein